MEPSEISANVGVNTISTLMDVLWFTDGHYEIFAEQICGIPAVFHQCYNKPERSKHRKRKVSSLSGDILHSNS